MIRILRGLMVAPERNADLLLAWLGLLAFQVVIPDGVLLSRPDLAPWLTLCVSVAALLRGRALGDGPHPSLTPRRVRWAAMAGRLSLVLAPIALLRWYDTAEQQSVALLLEALAWSAGVALLSWMGTRDGEVAWRPAGDPDWLWWTIRAFTLVGLAAALGQQQREIAGVVAEVMLVGTLLGLQMLAVGLLPDRLAWRWQRRAAGRRDGGPDEPSRFIFALALFGPAFGYVLLILLNDQFGAPYDFGRASVVSLYVLAWAAVLFPPKVPVAMSCVLHEIVPAGGRDPVAEDEAHDFDRPPIGALRLDPRSVKRLRVMHHWVVPVRDARIDELDDPVKPLWRRRPPALPYHVLGTASFLPDPRSQVPQTHTVTIRLDALEDITALSQGSVQTRRLAILRPWPPRARRRSWLPRTYRWDGQVSEEALQVVDATTEELTLRDGDIMVLSTEGVARAYELEIGSPVYAFSEIGHVRPPQLEDYVGGAG